MSRPEYEVSPWPDEPERVSRDVVTLCEACGRDVPESVIRDIAIRNLTVPLTSDELAIGDRLIELSGKTRSVAEDHEAASLKAHQRDIREGRI